MPNKKAVIIGGGFAGTSALKRLCGFSRRSAENLKIVLIDKKDNFEFLPMLPDIIGGWINPAALRVDLKKFCRRHKCEFVKDEVGVVDSEKRKINLSNGEVDYDYLLIAIGSETNFFNNESAGKFCFKLDDVDDGVKIRDGLLDKAKDGKMMNVAIVGGGYTGIEIAANVNYLFERKGIKHHIYILEKAADILMMVPRWVREEVRKELEKINIEIICNDSLEECDGKTVFLQSGAKIENAFCVWAAGVRTASFVEKMNVGHERSRIKVQSDLQIPGAGDKNVFAAGDAAWFFDDRIKGALRMAVMFSIAEGRTAAGNIINGILNKPLADYRPLDLGYLIPLARGKAPGVVAGKKIHGVLGYIMHYYMCLYRSDRGKKPQVIKI